MTAVDAPLVKVSAILGLGNPGQRYARNRHNFGYMVLDRLALLKKEEFVQGDGPFVFCKTHLASGDLILCKPTTFMNDVGRAAFDICERFGISAREIMVVSDDCNLPLGKIRFRKRGSDGGHKGLHSIICHLQSREFPRLRLGIWHPPPGEPLEEYVLANFNRKELKTVTKVIITATDFIEKLAVDGLDKNSVTVTVAEE
ncbi:MAG: aminoacyl-tRNA hydrolase [candidate division Zixibacteria bacterium 4484_95]|nr:MAG: aminoacyl-tRNA hydrolase [candidate division Zixibacteria bacterium 4484_95]